MHAGLIIEYTTPQKTISPYLATATDGAPEVNTTVATDDGGRLAFVVGLSVMSIVLVIIVVLVLVSVVAYSIFKRWSKSPKKAEYGRFFSYISECLFTV